MWFDKEKWLVQKAVFFCDDGHGFSSSFHVFPFFVRYTNQTTISERKQK